MGDERPECVGLVDVIDAFAEDLKTLDASIRVTVELEESDTGRVTLKRSSDVSWFDVVIDATSWGASALEVAEAIFNADIFSSDDYWPQCSRSHVGVERHLMTLRALGKHAYWCCELDDVPVTKLGELAGHD